MPADKDKIETKGDLAAKGPELSPAAQQDVVASGAPAALPTGMAALHAFHEALTENDDEKRGRLKGAVAEFLRGRGEVAINTGNSNTGPNPVSHLYRHEVRNGRDVILAKPVDIHRRRGLLTGELRPEDVVEEVERV